MVKEISVIHLKRIKEIIKNSEKPIKTKELKKLLNSFVESKEVEIIIKYLEKNLKIYNSKEGIIWIEASEKMKKALKMAVEI